MKEELSSLVLKQSRVKNLADDAMNGVEVPVASAENLLTDESRLSGRADRVFLPRSELELASVLRAAFESATPVTTSCGRTGITGGAVPLGGWLISFERMRRICGLDFDSERDSFTLRCQPGVSLNAVSEILRDRDVEDRTLFSGSDNDALAILKERDVFVFPPDPTEGTAGLGGMVACNASGARSLYYGPTRNYIAGVRMVMMNGCVLELKRGEYRVSGHGGFKLVAPDGTVRTGKMPGYKMPGVKSAAGYYARPGMDMLDLFIGSEGTLAVFSEIELRLVKAPERVIGVLGFFLSEEDAVAFVREARGHECLSSPHCSLMALEFFDARSLDLMREQKKLQGAASCIPALPEGAHTAIFAELGLSGAAESEDELALETIITLLESCRSDADTAWTGSTGEERERLKLFRHALPESVNQRIGGRAAEHPGLTKLGTDFAVPDERLADMLALYHSALSDAALEYVIFGHIGENHLHLNILPGNMAEYEKGRAICAELARQMVDWGGTVSGEHGIGKLKRELLALMFGDCAVAEMKSLKQVFDPCLLLNRGNVFE